MKVLRSTENTTANASPTSTTTKPSSTLAVTTKSPSQLKAKAFESNFDKDPSKLYLSIQQRKWDDATSRAEAYPEECKTWVSRFEDSGKLRWRLLPLHAAIIFKAPEGTIQALLLSYPRAAKHKDDQGMLPIHLTFRNESPVAIAQLLLMSFPQAVHVKDRKGREPSVIVANSRSPLKDQYVEALNLAASFHAVAIAAVESDMLHNFRKKAAIGNLEFDAEKINLMAKIDMLESELNKVQGASEILVNHVNGLESKLCSKNDTESFFATKITNIDSEMRQVTQAKELAEAQLAGVRKRLLQENDKLQAECDDLRDKLENDKSVTEAMTETIETELRGKNSLVERMRVCKEENEICKKEVEDMESLLKKKIESEHSLASQVSALASRLADSTSGTCSAANAFQKRINILMKEKVVLKNNVEVLTVKVQSVLRTLDYMAKEHDKILKLSTVHQKSMETAQEHQDSLSTNAARNEQLMIDAAWEREEIVRILTRQAKQVEQSSQERKRLMDIVKEQSNKMEEVAANRSLLIESIQEQKGKMSTLQKDIDILRKVTSDDLSFLSDGSEDSSFETITPSIVQNRGAHPNQINADDSIEAFNESNVSNIEADQSAAIEAFNESDMSNIETDESAAVEDFHTTFDEDTYEEKGTYEEKDIERILHASSMTNSDDNLLDEEDSVVNDDNVENALSLAEIESSVDHICSEAARLVASMPLPIRKS